MTVAETKRVPCGCTLIFEPFRSGIKVVTCQGSDGVWPDVPTLDRGTRRGCGGGIVYRLTAVEQVVYDAEIIDGGNAA